MPLSSSLKALARKLIQKNYYQKARYGYVDGQEPVNYVRNIRNRFEAYTNLTQDNLALLE